MTLLLQEEKPIEHYFIDWYSEAFAYGYGTGDEHYCKALVDFFGGLKENRLYDYEVLEKRMGAAECWFMINELCRQDMLEYGTSPRFGWLTTKGEHLRDFLAGKTADNLYDLINVDQDYNHCMKTYCNHTDAKEAGCRLNPFWFGES